MYKPLHACRNIFLTLAVMLILRLCVLVCMQYAALGMTSHYKVYEDMFNNAGMSGYAANSK